MDIKIVENNKDEIEALLEARSEEILERIGMKVEKYAKALCPVGTPESTGKKGYRGGTLRNSIDYGVSENILVVGSDVEYAPYVELGTGPYFTPPPEWEEFSTTKGSGIGHSYVHARPFLRPAIQDHIKEYEGIIKNELKK